ncbi:MAG: ABC transporter permease [bacterium]|nr:ABC transporter permease [bacterium]
MRTNARTAQLALILLPILAALGITALLILAIGRDPLELASNVWEGAFRNSRSRAGVVNFWIPLTLCGLGLAVTFTAGLWNIGIEGQMTMGAIFASGAALFIDLPAPLLIPLEIGLAMLGGMLWAAAVGMLKTRLGVNEIFGGVAFNALANVLTIYLISGPWQPAIGGSAQGTDPFPPNALLPGLSAAFPVNLLALLIVGVAVIGLLLALRGTRWGLQLKATGKNARSALLLGVPTERTALSAMLVCGALAGIAGSYRVLFTFENLRPLSSGGIGFLALLVALLVGYRVLWTPLVAFIVAALFVGSTRLQLSMQLDQSIAGVVQGVVVLLVVFANGLRERLSQWRPVPAAVNLPEAPSNLAPQNDPIKESQP